MGEGQLGLAQADAEPREIQRAEERRGDQCGVDGRAHVVAKPGQRQLLGAGAAADGGRAFEDLDPDAGPGQRHRRRQPVGTRTHDDGIDGLHGPTLRDAAPDHAAPDHAAAEQTGSDQTAPDGHAGERRCANDGADF